MRTMRRRTFLKNATMFPLVGTAARLRAEPVTEPLRESASKSEETAFPQSKAYSLTHIPNEYTLYLPGEREALENEPRIDSFGLGSVMARVKQGPREMRVGDWIDGWQLVAILPRLNAIPTAVFEYHATHQGALVYVTTNGKIAHIPKLVGDLSKIRPRPVNAPPEMKFERPVRYIPGPDKLGNYILNSAEDPCYENVAALGPELIGWTLVANEQAGPLKSLYLEANGLSRQFGNDRQSLWAPDLTGRLFDPQRLLQTRYKYEYEYVHGFSKRTLVGGFLPAADIGVWNPRYKTGYEAMVILPPGEEAQPAGRVRVMPLPADRETRGAADKKNAKADAFTDHYWNGSREKFYLELVGIWNQWNDFFNKKMQVEIPDEWIMHAARAGIVLSRCSYRGLNPSGQVGEGAYTEIPEHGHSFFPVDFYLFIWAHQLWNLVEEAEPYFEHYLKSYILPDGNFLYNTQEQVEAPLNAGVFLTNSARAYDYNLDFTALNRRLPVLRAMIDFVVNRYRYSKTTFPQNDPRHGLIWGSPEADNGRPDDDFPESHPYYYQNSSWTWRGLREHSRCLGRAAAEHHDEKLRQESQQLAVLAREMRADIERSLKTTLASRNAEMKAAGITPFTAFDINRKPTELGDYENHRYMEDWLASNWGDAALDEGHLKHRALAGMQMMGMATDGDFPETTNFMSFGTLAARIREEDYRSYLLLMYANSCYGLDCGNYYSPENALLPGMHPGEGAPYAWSAKVGSAVQPALGLRWLLCYEEQDRNVVHIQKAAPNHWFTSGKRIHVRNCPTRFGHISWTTESDYSNHATQRWNVKIDFEVPFGADLVLHIHTPNRAPLRTTSLGNVEKDKVVLPALLLAGRKSLRLEVS
jgi:hypothetical protein